MVAGKRADGRAYTHLDLGRLEGRDGAGERGGNAGHFCSCFFVLKEGEVCRNGARDAPNAHFIGAQLIHGRVGRRTTVSANRRARKNPVEQIYWRPGFYSRGSLTVVAIWLYGYPVSKTNAGCPISQIADSPRSIGRYDWLCEYRFCGNTIQVGR